MSEIDLSAAIKSIGGEVEEKSSLNNENTETTANAEVKTEDAPVEKTEVVPTTEAVKTDEVKPVTEEKQKEVVTEANPVKEDAKVEPEEYRNGLDLITEINSEFEKANGISIMEAHDFVNENYDDYEETDIVEEWMVVQDPGITPIEIKAEMKKYDVLFLTEEERKELIDEGKITQDDIDLLNAKFERLLRNSKDGLKNLQEKTKEKLSEYKIKSSSPKKDDNSEVIKKLSEEANKFLGTYQTEKFDIKDKDGNVINTISLNIDDADKKWATDIISDPLGVHKLWVDENGLNVEKMTKDLLYLRDRGKRDMVVYNQGLAKGALKEVKDLSNMDFSQNQTSANPVKAIDPNLQKLFNNIAGR